jgi:hypothetical protein
MVKFTDGYFTIKSTVLPPNSHMIFSIKEVIYRPGKPTELLNVGFTLIPLVDEKGFFYSGTYQLPVFKNDLQLESVETLQKEEPWGRMIELLVEKNPITKKPYAELIYHTSIIVRLKDSWYDELFETPLDVSRINYFFLPENKLPNYKYDRNTDKKLEKTKKMRALLPKDTTGDEYNAVVYNMFTQNYGVAFDDEGADDAKKKEAAQGQENSIEEVQQ